MSLTSIIAAAFVVAAVYEVAFQRGAGRALGTALAYASDVPRALARAAVDTAIDRGLALLASHRPTRVVAREDYMHRSYLLGRAGKGFPAGTPAVLGGLGGSAYLHRIDSADAGLDHHSHPWEWAISIVLAGGYDEETVGADGSISTRERGVGSVGLLSASTFHRIAELHAPRVWTLFIVGPRTPDSAWHFRRVSGEIVPQEVFHAELEAAAEEARREAWLNAVPPIRVAKDGEGPTPADLRAEAARLFGEWRERGWMRDEPATTLGEPILASEAATARGLEVHADLPPVGVPVETSPFTIGPVDVFAHNPVEHTAAVRAASTLKVPVAEHPENAAALDGLDQLFERGGSR